MKEAKLKLSHAPANVILQKDVRNFRLLSFFFRSVCVIFLLSASWSIARKPMVSGSCGSGHVLATMIPKRSLAPHLRKALMGWSRICHMLSDSIRWPQNRAMYNRFGDCARCIGRIQFCGMITSGSSMRRKLLIWGLRFRRTQLGRAMNEEQGQQSMNQRRCVTISSLPISIIRLQNTILPVAINKLIAAWQRICREVLQAVPAAWLCRRSRGSRGAREPRRHRGALIC